MRLFGSKVPEDLETPVTGGRVAQREARRAESARRARESALRRSQASASRSIVEKVEPAKVKMNGQNVSQAIQTIQFGSEADRDAFLLAEEFGRNRTSVLRAFGPVRRAVRDAYLQQVGLAAPEDTPVGGEESSL